MIKNILVVVTSPLPGQEEAYNSWYTDVHLPDVLKVPGFTAAQRFKLGANGPNGLPGSYLAIYEFETAAAADDVGCAFSALAAATETGRMWISPAMDPSQISASIFTPITERLLKPV